MSKATIFAWRLIRERLPTKNNLRRRNVETNDVICPFCRSHDEDEAHLFFTCANILLLWWELNVVGAFSENPKQHFLQHYYYNISGLRPQVADLVDCFDMVYLAA